MTGTDGNEATGVKKFFKYMDIYIYIYKYILIYICIYTKEAINSD